jgi:divalent metal cation (Fe/Co/Zn/Cd) transporter
MNREQLLERAFLLSAVSVAISGVAGGFAVVVGLASGRLSLLGFGFDAAIDAVASIVLLWRFRIEARHPARAERAERLAERVVGGVLILLGLYLGISTIQALMGDSHPASTPIGLAISLVSVILLPPLSLAKSRVAASLGSRALRADSILTAVAAALALIALAGFAATEWLGITWADAVGGLVIAVVLLREGASAFRRQGLSE